VRILDHIAATRVAGTSSGVLHAEDSSIPSDMRGRAAAAQSSNTPLRSLYPRQGLKEEVTYFECLDTLSWVGAASALRG
jgi:hypothetical protein